MWKKKSEDQMALNNELQRDQTNNEQLAQEIVDLQRKNQDLNQKIDILRDDTKNKEKLWRDRYDLLVQEKDDLIIKQTDGNFLRIFLNFPKFFFIFYLLLLFYFCYFLFFILYLLFYFLFYFFIYFGIFFDFSFKLLTKLKQNIILNLMN